MSNFKGYLLKFGKVELPNSYLMMSESNTSTPNQREEIKAYRDEYTRNLHRVTASGHKTKQTFRFKSLTDEQLGSLKAVMANSLVSEKERKYHITYWNDEILDYKEGDFYIPDITYTRARIDESRNRLYYAPFDMTIVEY